MGKLILYLSILLFLVFMCKNNSEPEKIENTEKIEVVNDKLTRFTRSDVARYAISTLFGQPADKISVEILSGGNFGVYYRRVSDNQKFEYIIKFEKNRIFWSTSTGSWRDGEYDEKVTFEECKAGLAIEVLYSDGSSDMQIFEEGD
jgi:hypothetical protein